MKGNINLLIAEAFVGLPTVLLYLFKQRSVFPRPNRMPSSSSSSSWLLLLTSPLYHSPRLKETIYIQKTVLELPFANFVCSFIFQFILTRHLFPETETKTYTVHVNFERLLRVTSFPANVASSLRRRVFCAYSISSTLVKIPNYSMKTSLYKNARLLYCLFVTCYLVMSAVLYTQAVRTFCGKSSCR